MKYLLSPHKKKSAGAHFDRKCAQKYGLKIIFANSSNSPKLLILFAIPFFPFLGVYSSLFLVRLIYRLVKSNLFLLFIFNNNQFLLSRTYLPGFRNYLVHNIEALYFQEEFLSSSSIIDRSICLHQMLVLALIEHFSFKLSNKLIFLSKSEMRLVRLKFSCKVSCLKLNLDSKKVQFCINKELPFVYFGDFSNMRNVKTVNILKEMHPSLRIAGRYSNELPYEKSLILGEISDLSTFAKHNVLFCPISPRAGVQTKLIEFLELGGTVYTSRKIWRRLP